MLPCFAAGDKLFRVVERKELPPSPTGSRRVGVVNKAAIRVLAWKLWSRSNVTYEIESTNRSSSDDVAGVCQQGTGLAGLLPVMQQQQQHQEQRVSFELVSSVSATQVMPARMADKNCNQDASNVASSTPSRLHTGQQACAHV